MLIASLTLLPSGTERLMISLHFPGRFHLRITPNGLIICLDLRSETATLHISPASPPIRGSPPPLGGGGTQTEDCHGPVFHGSWAEHQCESRTGCLSAGSSQMTDLGRTSNCDARPPGAEGRHDYGGCRRSR